MAEIRKPAEEDMLFVGDKGKILGGFRGKDPRPIPEGRMCAHRAAKDQFETARWQRGGRQVRPAKRSCLRNQGEASADEACRARLCGRVRCLR